MYIVEVSLQIKMDNLEIMGQKIQTKAKMTQLQQQRKSFSTLNWVAHNALKNRKIVPYNNNDYLKG